MDKENDKNSDSANKQDLVTSETGANNGMTSAENIVIPSQEIMTSLNSGITQDMTSCKNEIARDLTATEEDGLCMLPSSETRDLKNDNVMLPVVENLSKSEQNENAIPHCSNTGSKPRAFESSFNNDLIDNILPENKKLTENYHETVSISLGSGQAACGDLTKTTSDSVEQSKSLSVACDSSASHSTASNSSSKDGKMSLQGCEVLKSNVVGQQIQLKSDSNTLIGPVIRINDTSTNVDKMNCARNSESFPYRNIDLTGGIIELLDDDIVESASHTNLTNDQLVNKVTQNDAMASQSLQSIATIISNVSENSSLVESDVCIIDPPDVDARIVKSHHGLALLENVDQVASTSLLASFPTRNDDSKLEGSRNPGQNSFPMHSESSRNETTVSDSSMFLSAGRNKADTDIKRVPASNSTNTSHEVKNPSQIDMYQNSSKNRPAGGHARFGHHNLSSAVRMPQFDLMSQRFQATGSTMLGSVGKKTKEYPISDYRPADPHGMFGNRTISTVGSQVNRTSSLIGSQNRTRAMIGSQEGRVPSMRLPGDNLVRGGARQNVSGRGRGEGGRRMKTGFRMTTPAPNLANSRAPALGRGALPMPPLSVINQAAMFASDSVHQAFGLPFPNRGSSDALYLGSRVLPGNQAGLPTASSTSNDQPLDLTSRSATSAASDCQATDLRVNVTRNSVSEDPDCPLDLTVKKRKLNDGSPLCNMADSKAYQFSSNRSAFVPNRPKNTTIVPRMLNARQEQHLPQRGAFAQVPSPSGAKFRSSTPYASPLLGSTLSSLPGKMGPLIDPASPYCRSAYANQTVRHNRGDFGGGILGAEQAIRPAHQSGKFGSVLSEGPGHPIAVPVITHSATAMAQQAHNNNNPTSTMSDTLNNSASSQYTAKGLKDFRIDSRVYSQPLSPSKQTPLPPAHSYKSSFNPLTQQRLSSGGYAKEGPHPPGHSTLQMNNLCTGFTFSDGSVIDCSSLPSPSVHNPIHLSGHDPSIPSIDAAMMTGQNLTGMSDEFSRSIAGGFGASPSDQLVTGGWLPTQEGSYIDLTESSPTEGPSGAIDDCEPDVGQIYPSRTESVLSEMLTSHTSVYTGGARGNNNMTNMTRHHESERNLLGLNASGNSAFGISPSFGISHVAGNSSSSNDRFNQSISSSKSINESVGGEGGKMMGDEVGSRFILESDLRARRLSGQRSRVVPVANVQPIMKNQSTVVSESTSTNSASQSGGLESTEQPGTASCTDSKPDSGLSTTKAIESPSPAVKMSATVGLAISGTGFGAAGGLGASSFPRSKSGHSLHQSKSHHMEFLKFLHQKSASTSTSPNPMTAEAVNSRKRKRLTVDAQDEGTDVKQNPYRTPPEREDESTGSDGSNSNQLQKDQVESVKRQLLMIKTDSSIDTATSGAEVELDNGVQNRSLEAVYDAKGAIVGSAIISTCDSTRKHSNIEYIDDVDDDVNDDDVSVQNICLQNRNDDPSMSSGKKKQKKNKHSPDGAILQQISSSSGGNFSYTTFQMAAKKAAGFGVPSGFKRGGKAGRARGGLKMLMSGSGLPLPGEQIQGHCSTQGQGHEGQTVDHNEVSVDQSGQILGQGQEIETFQRKFSIRGKRGRGKLSGMGRGTGKHTSTRDVMIDAESSPSVDHIDHMDYTDSGFSSLASSAILDESSATGPSGTKLSPLGSGRGKIFHKSGQYKGKEKAKMKWREEDINYEGAEEGGGGVSEVAGESALHKATRLGYEDLVWYYLTSGDIHANVQDNLGQTPLHISCARSGLIQITRILLHHGAHPNSKSTDGTRPLHVAISNNDLKTVRLLISYGADVTLINDSKRSVVRLAKHRDMKNFLNAVLSDMTGGEEGVECPWEFNPFVKSNTSASANGLDILTEVPPDDEPDAMVGNFDQTDREQDLLTAHHLRLDSKKGPRNYHYVTDVLASSGNTVTIEDFTLLNDNLTHISIGRDTLQETLSLHGGSTMETGSTVPPEVSTPLCDETSDFVLGLGVKEPKPKTWCKPEIKSAKKGVVYEPVPEDVGAASEPGPEDELPQRVLRVNSVKGKDNGKKTLEKARLSKFKTVPLQSNEALGSAIKEEQKGLCDVLKSEESEFTDDDETKPKPVTPSPHKSSVIGKRLSQNKTPAAVGGLGCDIKPGSLFQGEVMFVQLDDALRGYLELSTTKRTLTTDIRGASRCKTESTDSSQNFFIDDKTKTEEYTVDIKDTPTKIRLSLKTVSTKLKWLPSETGGSLVIAKDSIGLSNKKKISTKDKYSLKQEIPADLPSNSDQQLTTDEGEVSTSNETSVNPGESSGGVSTKIVLQRNPSTKPPGRPLGSKSFHYKFKSALKRGAGLVRLDAASHIQTRSRKMPSESISAPCSDNDSPEGTTTEERSPSKLPQSSLHDWRVSHPCKVVLSQIDSGSTSTGGVAKWSVARFSSGEKRRLRTGRKVTTSLLYNRSSSADDLSGSVDDAGTSSSATPSSSTATSTPIILSIPKFSTRSTGGKGGKGKKQGAKVADIEAPGTSSSCAGESLENPGPSDVFSGADDVNHDKNISGDVGNDVNEAAKTEPTKTTQENSSTKVSASPSKVCTRINLRSSQVLDKPTEDPCRTPVQEEVPQVSLRASRSGEKSRKSSAGDGKSVPNAGSKSQTDIKTASEESTPQNAVVNSVSQIGSVAAGETSTGSADSVASGSNGLTQETNLPVLEKHENRKLCAGTQLAKLPTPQLSVKTQRSGSIEDDPEMPELTLSV